MPFPRGQRFGTRVWDRERLRDLVIEILREAGRPLLGGEIVARARARGYEPEIREAALDWRLRRILPGWSFRMAGRNVGWTLSQEYLAQQSERRMNE